MLIADDASAETALTWARVGATTALTLDADEGRKAKDWMRELGGGGGDMANHGGVSKGSCGGPATDVATDEEAELRVVGEGGEAMRALASMLTWETCKQN